jgi:2-aminoadipate transaminase
MAMSTPFSRRVGASDVRPLGLRTGGAPDAIFFGGGLPDPKTHPTRELSHLLAEISAGADPAVLSYAYERGDPALREAIAARLQQEGGALTADDIVLTNGSAGAIGLTAAALIDPGDVVVVEETTYGGALKAFRHMGARFEVAPMDAQGLAPEQLSSLLAEVAGKGQRTKLIYTIATCHNPTATTLSLARRREILSLAKAHEALVVEDYTYGDIRFTEMPPPFVAIDPEWSIQLGSFSKTIAPGLRTGWIAARPDVAQAAAEVRSDLGASPLLQRTIARFIGDGLFEGHLQAVTRHYRSKRDLMLASLDRHCRDVAEWNAPDGGFFVWLKLKAGDVHSAIEAAEHEKVAFIPGPYFAAEPGRFSGNLRLAYGEIAEELIEEGVRRLGRALSRATT